MLEAFKNKFK